MPVYPMGPLRQSKRARTRPPAEEKSASANSNVGNQVLEEAGLSTTAEPSTPAVNPSQNASSSKEDAATPLTASKSESGTSKQLNSKSSWYGTWPRKSTASVQVARESILADKPTNASSADLSRFEPKKTATPTASRPPSMHLGKSKETVDVTMGGTLEAENEPGKDKPQALVDENKLQTAAKPTEDVPAPTKTESIADTIPQRPATSSGWLGGWLSRPVPQMHAADECEQISSEPKSTQKPQDQTIQDQAEQEVTTTQTIPTEQATEQVTVPAQSSSSWFGLWSIAVPSTVAEAPKEEIPMKTGESGGDTVMEDAPSEATETAPRPAAGSSWAFWSTDTSKKPADALGKVETSGQLAVVGESSQNRPEPAKTVSVRDTKAKDKKAKSSKRSRPVSAEVEIAPQNATVEASTKATSQNPAPVKTTPPNLLLPSVKGTYRLVENASILQQITRLILYGQQKPVNHVFLAKEPPKIKKALAIGIHGLFPAPLLRTVIGQPTGTSIRFANHAADAIRRWTDKNGSVDCEIEKVALEGEGKIAERVDNLWKLLLNWIEHIRKADFIMVACHSQGVPVAMMLVAKLIEFGVVTQGKIGVCAMGKVSFTMMDVSPFKQLDLLTCIL